jgi:PKD repeat protein
MANLLRSFTLVCCLAAAVPLTAQREWHTWAFGQNAGITFVENGRSLASPKQLLRSPVFQSEGTASISDPCTGDLLFASDGYAVYGATVSTLDNGSMLLGENSATQAALLLPHPANLDRYYLFTAPDRASGLAKPGTTCSWNEIDRAALDGRGTVVRKNVVLPNATSERLCAVLRPDGVSYWVVMMSADTTVFLVYGLDANGLNETPVVSAFPLRSHHVGYMKVSHDGSKLAIASPLYGVELFDFDIATGAVSNRRVLITDENRSRVGAQVYYGLEWSPKSNMLYASSRGSVAAVVQFDISQDRLDLIALSATEVMRQSIVDVYSWAFPLQLGPTGHIYIGAAERIHAITDPDSRAPDCGFRPNVLTLSNARVNDGFPNIPAGGFTRPSQRLVCPPPLPRFTSRSACVGKPVTFRDSSQGYPTQWFWQFSGGNPNQFSGERPPQVRYSEPGTYVVVLRVQNDYGSATHTDTVVVHPPPGVYAGRDQTACRGQTVSLDGRTNGTSYVWQPGHLVSDSTVLNPTVEVSSDVVVLTLKATSEFGCEAVDTIVIRSSVVAAVVPADTAICQGQTVFLTAGGGSAIDWFLADGTFVASGDEYFATPDTSMRYTVVVRTNDCVDTAYVNVLVHPRPVFDVSNDTTICVGDTVQLMASGGFEYLWTPINLLDDPTSATPRAFPSTTTTFRVTAISEFGCSSTSTVVVAVASPGSLQLPPDTTICQGASVALRALGMQGVAWFTSSGEALGQTATVVVQPLVTTTYVCTTLDARCPVADSITITVVPIPRVDVIQSDTSCVGRPVVLLATGALDYRWFNQENIEVATGPVAMFTPAQPMRLRVVGTGLAGCEDSAEIDVAVLPRMRTSLAIRSSAPTVQPSHQLEIEVTLDPPVSTPVRVAIALPRAAWALRGYRGSAFVGRHMEGDDEHLVFDVAADADTVAVLDVMALLHGSTSAECRTFLARAERCTDVTADAIHVDFTACELQRRVIAFVERSTIVVEPAGRGIVVTVPPSGEAIVEFWSVLGDRVWTTVCKAGVHRFDEGAYPYGWIRLTDAWGTVVKPAMFR